MTVNYPHLYITFYKNYERHTLGPFYTLSPDGCGDIIKQDWICYQVQDQNLEFRRITVQKAHLIEYK